MLPLDAMCVCCGRLTLGESLTTPVPSAVVCSCRCPAPRFMMRASTRRSPSPAQPHLGPTGPQPRPGRRRSRASFRSCGRSVRRRTTTSWKGRLGRLPYGHSATGQRGPATGRVSRLSLGITLTRNRRRTHGRAEMWSPPTHVSTQRIHEALHSVRPDMPPFSLWQRWDDCRRAAVDI